MQHFMLVSRRLFSGSAQLVRTIVAILIVGSFVSPILAEDTIMLNDGKIYSGTILSETAAFVEIETKIGTIATTMKIDRGRITSIVKGHREWHDTDRERPADQAPAAEENPRTRVLEIPLRGEFGRDILPFPFRHALEQAKRSRVEHIVIRVDSDGGAVWAAQQIMRTIDEYKDDFRFHAVVVRGISASIWPIFACDTIHMIPGSSLGGAVAYSQDRSGRVEVDAKMNSIWASEIVNLAVARGHNADVVRAMVLMPSAVYAERIGSGWRLTGSRPFGGTGEIEVVDGPTTVLTLTTQTASRFGIASERRSAALDETLRAVGLESWEIIDEGARILERWLGECERRRRLADSSAEKLLDAFQAYEQTEDIDEAINSLVSFQREHPRFAKYLREMQECYPMGIEDADATQIQELSEIVREEIKRLRKLKRDGP